MIIKIGHKSYSHKPRKWFAWRPVIASDGNGIRCLVWLETLTKHWNHLADRYYYVTRDWVKD